MAGRCILQAMREPDRRPPVIFGSLAGSSPRTTGHRKPRSKRFGEPLAPARFRPPYVRNHCYAAAHGGTS